MDAEKIICCEGGCNNNGLLEAALLGNGNGFGGNNAMWLLFLLLLGGRGWNGFGNGQGVSSEFSILQNQAQDNQNATLLREGMRDNYSALQMLSQNLNCDFNTLQQCCCDLKAAVAQVAGKIGYSAERVINAVNLGDLNIIQQLKDCCCTTQKAILEQGYQNQLSICNQTNELRNGQRDLGQAITQGFSQTAFQAQQDKCDIIRASHDNTQRIIDVINANRNADKDIQLQDMKTRLANAELYEKLRNGSCGCNTGCGNGCGF